MVFVFDACKRQRIRVEAFDFLLLKNLHNPSFYCTSRIIYNVCSFLNDHKIVCVITRTILLNIQFSHLHSENLEKML